jgi:hypothetical protein
MEVDLPIGVHARLDPPVGPDSVVKVDGLEARPDVEIGPGLHLVEVTNPRVIPNSSPD